MRTFIFILLSVPSFLFSQTSAVFIKLTDAKGTPVNGDVVTRGFEKSIRALTLSNTGKNNTQLNFTMPVTGAGAALKSAMAGNEQLLNATVFVMVNGMNGTLQTSYTIKMERISVVSCSESMGCNNAMTTAVTLQATRIGWTYYTTDRAGNTTVSQKYGFDAATGKPWTNF
ncbi:MAG: hypothetical protein GC171_12175 [Terrimonas sp.]|nr:hypothetical protein [Terrimonas sp.]